MQQSRGQTWNGGAPISNGGPGTTGPPLAAALHRTHCILQWRWKKRKCHSFFVCSQFRYMQLNCGFPLAWFIHMSNDWNDSWKETDTRLVGDTSKKPVDFSLLCCTSAVCNLALLYEPGLLSRKYFCMTPWSNFKIFELRLEKIFLNYHSGKQVFFSKVCFPNLKVANL